MAYGTQAPTQANSNSKRRPVAYLNVTIKDSEGNDRKIGGIPLYEDNGTHCGILNKNLETQGAKAGTKEAKHRFELSYDINENGAGKTVIF